MIDNAAGPRLTAKWLIGTVLLSFLLIQAWWLVYLFLTRLLGCSRLQSAWMLSSFIRTKLPFLMLIRFYLLMIMESKNAVIDHTEDFSTCGHSGPMVFWTLNYLLQKWRHYLLCQWPCSLMSHFQCLFISILLFRRKKSSLLTQPLEFNQEILSTMKTVTVPHFLWASWWPGCPQRVDVYTS